MSVPAADQTTLPATATWLDPLPSPTFGLRRDGRIHYVSGEQGVRLNAAPSDEIVRATTVTGRVQWDTVCP